MKEGNKKGKQWSFKGITQEQIKKILRTSKVQEYIFNNFLKAYFNIYLEKLEIYLKL